MGNCKKRLTSRIIQKLYFFEAYSFTFISINRRFSTAEILRKPQTKETLWICASKVAIEAPDSPEHMDAPDSPDATGMPTRITEEAMDWPDSPE